MASASTDPDATADAGNCLLCSANYRLLREDGVLARDDAFSWAEVFATFKKPHVLLMCIAGFFNGASMARRFRIGRY